MLDRRVKKSRRALKDALVELMKRKDLEKISIKELCELADVNRSTFYANYEDINELLKAVHYELLDKVNQPIESKWWDKHEGDDEEAFLRFKEMIFVIMENKQNFLLFVNNNKNNAFELNFFQYYKEMQKIEEQDDYQNYLFTYHTMGYSAVIQSWLRGGCQLSCEEMARMLWDEAAPFHRMMKKR